MYISNQQRDDLIVVWDAAMYQPPNLLFYVMLEGERRQTAGVASTRKPLFRQQPERDCDSC